MFKNLSIRIKIAIIVSLCVLFTAALLGTISYVLSRKTLQSAYSAQLTSIRELKKRRIEAYFSTLYSHTKTLAEDRSVIDAAHLLKTAFLNSQINDGKQEVRSSQMKNHFQSEFMKLVDNKGTVSDYMSTDPRTQFFQAEYISNNPNPNGAKDKLDRAIDNNEYNRIHAIYHPSFRSYVKEFRIHDMFLVDPKTGYVFYSMFKEVDFATSLIDGPFKGSNLAEIFNEMKSAAPGTMNISRYKAYAGSYFAPAAFMATPIYDKNELVSVLIIQIPLDEVNNAMTSSQDWKTDGMGMTGESYLITATDHTMRSASRFMIEDPNGYFKTLKEIGYSDEMIETIRKAGTPILYQKIETEASMAAINGTADVRVVKDYRGVSVLSAFTPLNITGVKWVMLVEIDEDEVFAPIDTLRNMVLVAGGAVIVLAIIVALFVASSIAKPIVSLTEKLGLVSNGDLTVVVEATSKDEIGNALSSLQSMISKLKEVIGGVISSADQITIASTEMNQSSQQMSEGATEQASSAEEVSSSMEEMAASIQQNTDNAKETEKTSRKAALEIEESSKAVNETVESMKTIAEKITIIGEIARQTNLLALNAAVEAARAGEHGKGFAVVAAEVRRLAERSQQAAAEINSVSKTSVEIAQKSGKMLNDVVPGIQKTAELIKEISTASSEMTTGADQVNTALQQLNQVVQKNAANAEEVAATSEELNSQSINMKELVSYFNIGEHTTTHSSKTKEKNQKANQSRQSVHKVETKTAKVKENGKSNGVHISLGSADAHDDEYQKF
jgi:methyl-accepting chemotaxis protein